MASLREDRPETDAEWCADEECLNDRFSAVRRRSFERAIALTLKYEDHFIITVRNACDCYNPQKLWRIRCWACGCEIIPSVASCEAHIGTVLHRKWVEALWDRRAEVVIMDTWLRYRNTATETCTPYGGRLT
jgi:hypothetical protein